MGRSFLLFRTALTPLALCAAAALCPAGQLTGTIYVNRHFEVRDHDQPTKYVFNGDTRVAAVTGSLSLNHRVQRLRLYPGWNLCSLAVTGPVSGPGTEGLLAAYQWDPVSRSYSVLALGQTLAAGTILWLKMSSNAVLSLNGTYRDPVAGQTPAGGTYVPGTGLEAWLPVLPDGTSAWEFNNAKAQWSDSLSGDLAGLSPPLAELSPGQALFFQTPVPVSLQPPDPSLRIRYYHQDHLGSSSVVTDGAAALVEETAFLPFGLPRNQVGPRQVREPYEFTQKERDTESGLQYFEARYLDPSCARFLGPDRKYANPDGLEKSDLAFFLAAPQELNLYSYVQNTPFVHTDPTGLGWWSDFRNNVWIPIVDPVSQLDVGRTAALGDEKRGRDYNDDIDEVKGWFGKAKSELVGGPSIFELVNKELEANRNQQAAAAQNSAGGPPPASSEAQKRVLSLIAHLVSDADDMLNQTHPAHTMSRSPGQPPPPATQPQSNRERGANAGNQSPLGGQALSISKSLDAPSP